MKTLAVTLGVVAVLGASGGAACAGDTLVPPLRVGDEEAYLQLYGQFSPSLLVVDDGRSTLGYGPIDNSNASSRLGLRLYVGINSATYLGADLEGEYDGYATNYVDQLNRGGWDGHGALLRHAEGYLSSKPLGTLWLGQGDMASNNTAEVDLSGTDVVGYSSVSDLAGGQFFAYAGDAGLSAITVADAGDGLDGLEPEAAFEPFASGGDGSGLGLAFVAHVARVHGGDARIEPGPGTRVTIDLARRNDVLG